MKRKYMSFGRNNLISCFSLSSLIFHSIHLDLEKSFELAYICSFHCRYCEKVEKSITTIQFSVVMLYITQNNNK